MSFTVPTEENHQHNASVTLTVINCGCCGGTYAINERMRKHRLEQGGGWNCPYCKRYWGYFGNSLNDDLEKEKKHLKSQLANEQKRTEWAQQEAKIAENRRRAEKAAKTRIKNRIANGVCPCCNRSFKDLHRHMQSQHPDYGASHD